MAESDKRDVNTNDRSRWGSRWSFILAAIGSAVGLGNVWRFPALVYKFGGGPFFIPYLLALFFLGLPLLLLEFSLGQAYQSGDVIAFGTIHERLRGIGFASIFETFVIVVYYNQIIAWSLYYFGACFTYPLPWMPGPIPENTTGWSATDNAAHFMWGDVVRVTDPDDGFQSFNGATYALLLFTWLVIFLCIMKGVVVTGKIVWVTCTLPVLILFVLLFQAVSLPGHQAGIEAFIGRWDFSVLSESPTIWSEAVTQVFFSIGVTFGCMTAYASYNSRNARTVQDTLIVGFSNSMVSFIAGFSVFGILGYLADQSNQTVDDVTTGGLTLAFVTYPVGLGLIGGDAWGAPVGAFLCSLFFLTLFFLGIDSAFSLVEAVCTSLKDSRRFNQLTQVQVSGAVCLIGAVLGAFYSSNQGLNILDVVDYFINNIAMCFVGLMEAVAAGWVYGLKSQIEKVGQMAVTGFALSWFFFILIIICFGLVPLPEGQTQDFRLWALISLLWLPIGIALSAKSAMKEKGIEAKEALYVLFFHNIETLRADLNKVVTRNGGWRIPFVWSLCIKYVIPLVLATMFSLTIDANIKEAYGKYPSGFQATGIVLAMVGVSMIIIGLIVPKLYLPWMPPPDKIRVALGNENAGVELAMNEETTGEGDEEQPLKNNEEQPQSTEGDQPADEAEKPAPEEKNEGVDAAAVTV